MSFIDYFTVRNFSSQISDILKQWARKKLREILPNSINFKLTKENTLMLIWLNRFELHRLERPAHNHLPSFHLFCSSGGNNKSIIYVISFNFTWLTLLHLHIKLFLTIYSTHSNIVTWWVDNDMNFREEKPHLLSFYCGGEKIFMVVIFR